MKDGRPSRIFDIRYFGPNKESYLKGGPEINAYGRRMAWYLNSENLSLGAYHSLYVCFTPSLVARSIEVSDEGSDWWHRYAYVGVSEDFSSKADADTVSQGTITALKRIRPDARAVIDQADNTVRRFGADLRYLVKSKPYKKFDLHIATTIPTHPYGALLYVKIVDKESGSWVELEPIIGGIYSEAFRDADGIGIRDIDVTEFPNGNFSARWSDKEGRGSPNTATNMRGISDPFYSKLVVRA